MKLQNYNDVNNEILKNPKEFIFINGKFYKQNSNELILINGHYEVLNEKDHVKDYNNKWCYKRNCNNICIINSKGEKINFYVNFGNADIKNLNGYLYDHLNDINLFPNRSALYDFLIPLNRDKENQYILSFQRRLFGLDYSKSKKGNLILIANFDKETTIKECYNNLNCDKLDTITKLPETNLIAKNDLTFGVEIETSAGYIDFRDVMYENLNLKCERDGSITGGEYITGVLSKDIGFYDLYKTCKLISRYCDTNQQCGIHVHIGNISFNKTFTNFAYILACKIQDDLFTFLDKTRSNNVMCGLLDNSLAEVGKTLYSEISNKKLADNYYYSYLFKKMIYANNNLGKQVNKNLRHPGGRYCGRYQNPFDGKITNEQFRYKWLNFISCNFQQKGALTIEFRPYHATLDYEEIRDWVLFCMAFTLFVINNSQKILNTNYRVKDIVSIYPGLYDRMISRSLKSNINSKTKVDYRNYKEFMKNEIKTKKECV